MTQPSNFDFFKSEFPDFAKAAKLAERAVYPDPHGACFHCRRTLELVVHWLYRVDSSLHQPYDNTLGSLLHEPSFQNLLPENVFAKARLLQKVGNQAVHGSKPIYQLTAQQMVGELHHILYWVARTYTRNGADKLQGVNFDVKLIPFPKSAANPADKAKLKAQEQELNQHAKDLAKKDAEMAEMDAELEALKLQLSEAKQINETVPDNHDYSEDETRKHIIDAELERSGWDLKDDNVIEYKVTGMPNKQGVGFVDYVLWGEDGKPLAVVEAKRTSSDAEVGQQQAKLYADCLEQMHGQRPLIFYTNGYETFLWDDTAYPPRKVAGFYKRGELERLVNRRSSLKELKITDINEDIAGRYYQKRAIVSIGEVLVSKRRKSLLVMATGTGKTRTSIALVDLLQRCNWAKNVLFLADRISLVNQATGAFKAHLPEATPVNLVTEKDKQGRVYTCTYPTMMGLIDSLKNGEARFSPGHFDLIIIDEAHRSIYKKYKAIFEYFDSLLVGLTATPREEVDKNTYELFDLEPGVPTDAYELEKAVSDGFLVPPTAQIVDMKFPREGITYDDLSNDEKEEWETLDWSGHDEPILQKKVSSPSVNKWLFNIDTADKVLNELMTNGHKVAGGDRLAKTIIFARNHKHAEFIEKRFNHHYPNLKGRFARIIDNYSTYPQSLIDEFSIPEKDPHIAISVDMLDTGIDVPEVCNLVFFKPVYSKIKFWQMIGRGTRLCPNLYGDGHNKQDFRVFDFCGNFDFFKEAPDGIVTGGTESLSTRLFRKRVELLEATQDAKNKSQSQTIYNIRQTLQQQVSSMHMENFQVRMKREFVEPIQSTDFWKQLIIPANDLLTLSEDIAPLPDTLEAEKLEAKTFDSTLLTMQLALVTHKASVFESKRKVLIDTAGLLEEKANIPAVKEQLVLIQAMQEVEFWEGITLDILEDVRLRIRDLTYLLDKRSQGPVYTGFKDEIISIREEPVINVPVMTGAQYEKKVKAALQQSLDRLEIKKLREGKPLTPQDTDQLQQMLITLGDTAGQQLLDNMLERNEVTSLPLFIRCCVGMSRQAALEHFSEYLNNQNFNSSQIRFVELIVTQLTANGIVSTAALYDIPFSNIHAGGPEALFPNEKILDGIFDKVRELNQVAG